VALPYMPALDGLRALAVIAVLAYHADLRWAQGGFLGVDVFFVLSGFLVTALLLTERQRFGNFSLARFWGRRARRLLPAVAVLLAAVAVAVPLLASDQGYRLRGDLGAALAYVSNWRLIFEEQSYFQATGRPPLLQHLWSLAVEEQFYLLWPLALGFGLRRTGRRRKVGAAALVLAGASTVLMAVLHDPAADPSRVYYGTDTRLAALLVGAALACYWPARTAKPRPRVPHAVLEVAGLAALVGLLLCVRELHQYRPGLYRGGFLGVALLAAVIVAVGASRRPTLLSRFLAQPPLVWLGKRSYSVYLWFWPVFMLTRPYADVPFGGWRLLVLRLAITLGLAMASYRFVEEPIRNGALSRLRPSPRRGEGRWPLQPAITWGVALALVVGAIGTGVLVQRRDDRTFVATAHAEVEPVAVAAPSTTEAATTTIDPTTTTVDVSATVAPDAPLPTDPPPPSEPRVVHARVTAIGESVLLAARRTLEASIVGLELDAAIGRHTKDAIAVARERRAKGQLADLVVVHVGNNGPVTPGQFDDLMEALSGVERVIVVNVRVPRPWEGPNNEVLADGVKRTPNAVLADWNGASSSHPEVFADDGVHFAPAGERLFVELIVSNL
ncbi:MAG TPA: acyltransferase family protein, partial [Acidimicrobiales bacterium]|nr:acyltransferase family protein [Acidimicrobiales bacterium]